MNNQHSNILYQLPIDIVEQLLCSQCKCYISSGPVKMQPDGGSICGRCSPSNNEVYGRNLLFETAMSTFAFPCRYKKQGCNENMLFGNTAEHEAICPYKTFICPSLPPVLCFENVTVFDIFKHFNENHFDLISKDGKFKLDLKQSKQSNLLMMVEEIVIIIQYNYDKNRNILNLNVEHFACNNTQTLLYKAQISSGLDLDRIIHFKELPCHRYQSHAVTEQNGNDFLMCNYLPALDNPTIIFVKVLVTIGNKNSSNTEIVMENVLSSSIGAPSKIENHDDVVEKALVALNNVRCYSCKYYCVSPVFEGLLPNNSRETVIACLKCMQRLRNPIQKVIEELTYPCRWRTCTFIGNANNIEKHEEECLFQSCFCPVDLCKEQYFTRNNLVGHMLSHGTYIPDPKHMIIKLSCKERANADPIDRLYFVVYEEALLTFKCRILGNNSWVLTSKGCEGFSFEIHFEHGHCRVKTPTFSITNDINLNTSSVKTLPNCFQVYNSLTEAIIKIERLHKRSRTKKISSVTPSYIVEVVHLGLSYYDQFNYDGSFKHPHNQFYG